MIELVLDQRHELGVTTASAVIGVQRDDEIRDMAEPLLDLHLGTSAGPLAHRALWRSCLTLADDTPALLAVADDGPEEADVNVASTQSGMSSAGANAGEVMSSDICC